ncbi:MAG: CPBP family intramembrane metalloprotease [Bacteroidetes bacterium]|nr:CPBP family intramembrane metalloprotease [Bacteroidota bacterium]
MYPLKYPAGSPFGRASFTPTTVLFFSVGMMLLLQQLVLPLAGFALLEAVSSLPVREMALGKVAFTPEGAALVKSYLAITHLIVFGLLSWVMARATGDAPGTLGLRRGYHPWLIPAGLILVFLALPGLQFTVISAEQFSLPTGFEALEEAFREIEINARKVLKSLLKDDLPTNLVVVALLPAVLEEFFFRGLLQNTCKRMMGPHAAIWLTAFIFSCIHFQILGFFYRMLLGALFGYLYHWSGSIWPAVAGHLLNNSLGVLAFYGIAHWGWDEQLADDSISLPIAALVSSLVLSVLGLYFYRKWALRSRIPDES